jgi:hypothetical protein
MDTFCADVNEAFLPYFHSEEHGWSLHVFSWDGLIERCLQYAFEAYDS